jgi:hypothetical protein
MSALGETYCLNISPEDGDSMFLRNNGMKLKVHTALNPEDQYGHLHRGENLKSLTLIRNVKIKAFVAYGIEIYS